MLAAKLLTTLNPIGTFSPIEGIYYLMRHLESVHAPLMETSPSPVNTCPRLTFPNGTSGKIIYFQPSKFLVSSTLWRGFVSASFLPACLLLTTHTRPLSLPPSSLQESLGSSSPGLCMVRFSSNGSWSLEDVLQLSGASAQLSSVLSSLASLAITLPVAGKTSFQTPDNY